MCTYVSVQAKRALSHCYQNVQNLSKQPIANNSKYLVLVLFNEIAYSLSSKSLLLIQNVIFENETFSSNIQSHYFKSYRVMWFNLECRLILE